jgi:hypothetical protein
MEETSELPDDLAEPGGPAKDLAVSGMKERVAALNLLLLWWAANKIEILQPFMKRKIGQFIGCQVARSPICLFGMKNVCKKFSICDLSATHVLYCSSACAAAVRQVESGFLSCRRDSRQSPRQKVVFLQGSNGNNRVFNLFCHAL